MSIFRIIVASKSTIKRDAVSDWIFHMNFNSLDVEKGATFLIESREAGRTSCAQPQGINQAMQCAEERVKSMLSEKERLMADRVCAIVVIENYIEYDWERAVLEDFSLVVIHTIKDDSSSVRLMSKSLKGIKVPEQFDPIQYTDQDGYCNITVGQLIHASDETVAADDWFRYVCAENPTRKEQIRGALEPLSAFFSTLFL